MKNILSIILTIIITLMLVSCFTGGFGGIDSGLSGTGNMESYSKDGVKFKNHIYTNFGFDAKTTEINTYISIKSGSNLTTFVANLFNVSKGLAVTSNAACASISAGPNLISGDNPIEIRSGSSPSSCQIKINGCTSETVNDCYVEKNYIDVHVYDEKIVPLKIVKLNNTTFDWFEINNIFNQILKQAVYKASPISTQTDFYFNKSRYDRNNNDRLDFWISNTPENCELDDIRVATGADGYWSQTNPGIVVVEENIRTHVILKYSITAGSTMLNVNAGDEKTFKIGSWISLGPVDGSTTDLEQMWIRSNYDAGIIYMQRGEYNSAGTRYAHPATKIENSKQVIDHSIWSDYAVNGVASSIYNFAVLGENADCVVAVHEFLHMPISGALKHVVDDDNIMYNGVGAGKLYLLRYRPLKNPEGSPDQNQWTMIHQ